MSSTERVRLFRERHGLTKTQRLGGGLTLAGVRPPAAPARRSRKRRPMPQVPAELAPLPMALPEPALPMPAQPDASSLAA